MIADAVVVVIDLYYAQPQHSKLFRTSHQCSIKSPVELVALGSLGSSWPRSQAVG